MKIKLLQTVLLGTLFCTVYPNARDIILEFKAAYFLPTNSLFKKIFHNGGALFGPELTVQLLCGNKHWYGFASVDYFHKKGKSLGLSNPTSVTLVPLGFGLKYFYPVWCDRINLYAGLGFQPVYAHTKNDSPYVLPKQTQWGFGGIVKGGSYIDLSCNFLLDLFIGYSFVTTSRNKKCCISPLITTLNAHVSGAIFGGGLAYCF